VNDEALRELERVAESGDLEAAAQLLLERVRVGELGMAQVRLAAYLDHAPAVLAVEGRPRSFREPLVDPATPYGMLVAQSPLRETFSSLEELLWLRGLWRWGLEAVTRGGIAWVRLRPEDVEPGQAEGAGAFQEALDAWLEEPSLHAHELVQDRLRSSGYLGGSVSWGAEFVALAQGPPTAHTRHDVCVALEGLGWPNGADLEVVCAEILPWALSEASRGLHEAKGELRPGASLRQGVIESETTANRLEAINLLVRSSSSTEEEIAVVVHEQGVLEVRPLYVTVQRFSGFPVADPLDSSAEEDLTSFDLDEVIEVSLRSP
jgi:hypothetical protein